MTSFRAWRVLASARDHGSIGPALAAVTVTGLSFLTVLLSMRPISLTGAGMSPAREAAPEHVAMLTLRARQPVHPASPVARGGPVPLGVKRVTKQRPLPVVSAPPHLAAVAETTTKPAEPLTTSGPTHDAPSLVPTPEHLAPWFAAPKWRNPLLPPDPRSSAEYDAALRAVSAAVPELAARRVPSRSEVDASAKEAMLKMRLLGRILLVPPDNSGGLVTASLPFPVFRGSRATAGRLRADSAADDNRRRLEHLRQRADSLRRARADSSSP